jgi:ABC-type antimicrobial peptide transport system permease subunit
MYDLSKMNLDEELSALGFDSSVDSVLKTNILDDYNYRYSSMSHDFTVELIESCVAIFLMIMMQYIFIRSEMTYKAKEFAIKSSLGYTKAEKYWGVVLIEMITLIIALAVGLEFGNSIHTDYKYVLTAFALITVTDFISIAFFVNKVEKAKVVRLIKGAAL